MADINILSDAAGALTEGIKIYADIKDRENRAAAELEFTDRLNQAGGVEFMTPEDLMGASNFLSKQQIDLGRDAIRNRRSIDLHEANRKYNEEQLLRDREFKKTQREETRQYEAGLKTEGITRTADLLTEKQEREDVKLTTKQKRSDALLVAKQEREDELRAEGRTYDEAQTLSNREYDEAIAATEVADKAALEEDEVAATQRAMDSVTALSEKYGGLNKVPKIQLLPYVDAIPDLDEYIDPERIVGKAGDAGVTEDPMQEARDAIFYNGDTVAARKLLRATGMSKTGVNNTIKDIKKAQVKIQDANEVLNIVSDIIDLPDEDFGLEGQATDWLSSLKGSLGWGGKASKFKNKMATLTVDYATQKLKGILSDQDMERIQGIVGDTDWLRLGPEDVRQTLGDIQVILERTIEQARTGITAKRQTKPTSDVDLSNMKPGDTIDLGNGVTMKQVN